MENPPDSAPQPLLAPVPAPPPRRVLFRAEALEHYRRRQEQVALPRFITGGYAALLWALALLLVGGTVGVVFALRGLLLSQP